MRILAEVDWNESLGGPNDPRWPNYEQELGELIDYAYDEVGIRTQITVLGGVPTIPYTDLFNMVARVANARPHKIQFLEVANEGYGGHISRGLDLEGMLRWGKWLIKNTQNLVAITDPGVGSFYPDIPSEGDVNK
jgi:uncharacterized protein (UPF0371 family)